VLSWSAVLVTLRGNFRHTLNASGRQQLDLICAGAAAAMNVLFNLVLIPRYGIEGAAWATLLSEVGWFLLARHLFTRYVMAVAIAAAVWRPAVAGLGMAAVLVWGPEQWMVRAVVAGCVYAGVLVVLGERLGAGEGRYVTATRQA
jgi:O-antigen/teichoic acid export membrane protein